MGLALPGEDASPLGEVPLEADLRFLVPPPDFTLRMDLERRRARADFRRLAALLDGGLWARVAARLDGPPLAWTREHHRALAVAYRGDLDGVRSLLSAEEILAEARESALKEELRPRRFLPAPALHRTFHRWWTATGGGDRAHRRATWRRIRHDVDGAEQALRAWATLGPAGAREAGEVALAEILRHPQRLSEQVVTLRAVQTLALIDLLNYREHVWRLGRYADDGDDPAGLLSIDGPGGV